jgi:hypothetical protein
MRTGPILSRLVLLQLLLSGCDGASAQSGVTSFFRLQDGQFVPGAIDSSEQSPTPEIHRIDSTNNTVYPGITGKSINGAAGPGSMAVLIGMQGDSGYWIVPVRSQDQTSPGDFVFSAKASFSPTVPPGPALLLYRAVGVDGEVGPASTQALEIVAPAVQGGLVISLDWDSEADLDLRVTAPNALGDEVEIWSRNKSSLVRPAPGAPPPSDADLAGAGVLDFDSNSQCVIDGRCQENVVWTTKPAPSLSLYSVRVDAFSMCGEVLAHWRVQVLLDGQVVSQATGQFSDLDTRFDHGPGAGLRALEFRY